MRGFLHIVSYEAYVSAIYTFIYKYNLTNTHGLNPLDHPLMYFILNWTGIYVCYSYNGSVVPEILYRIRQHWLDVYIMQKFSGISR